MTVVSWMKKKRIEEGGEESTRLSELKKVGGCQQKASHLRIKLHPVSNRFKYHFMIPDSCERVCMHEYIYIVKVYIISL